MNFGLEKKVALVTAAGKGIGFAVAKTLSEEGATVAVSSRDIEALKKTISSVGSVRGSMHPYRTDLSNSDEAEAIVQEVIADHGRLDIVVLNTPGPRLTALLETNFTDWTAAYETLVRPCVQIGLAAARHMKEQGGGSIIFLTSTWVRQPAIGGGLSSVMRSSLATLSKQMSLELAPFNIRVNQVQPGATATARLQGIVLMKAEKNGTSVEEERQNIVDQIPLGRWGEPQEIADAVAFLASNRSQFTTGVSLQIDGGAIRSTS